jgi:hypothetical protein
MIRMSNCLFEQKVEVRDVGDLVVLSTVLGVQHCLWIRTGLDPPNAVTDVTSRLIVQAIDGNAVVAGVLAYASVVQQEWACEFKRTERQRCASPGPFAALFFIPSELSSIPANLPCSVTLYNAEPITPYTGWRQVQPLLLRAATNVITDSRSSAKELAALAVF